MHLFKMIPDNTNVGFVKWRNIALWLTLIATIGSAVLLMTRGLNYGVDFAGGLMMEVGFEQPVNVNKLRQEVNRLGVGDSSIQQFGSPDVVSIRLPLPDSQNDQAVQTLVKRVQKEISADYPKVSFRRVETVSGKVSSELIRDGALSAVIAMIAVSAYIWFRFEWQFGIGAMLSLVHDVLITLGFFSLTQLEFNLNIVASILTIIGYSLNDTIVNYDRIRENLRKYRKMEMAPLLDLSINEMLARTVMTSLTTALALTVLLIWGGEVLRGFTAAMLLGIFVGTYSSIYVAGPLLLWMKVGPHTFVPPDLGSAERVTRP